MASAPNFFSLNITTTRGCPFKCNWCAKPIYGNRYNSRSPADVVNEIDYLQRLFNFQHIWFCDDIFGLKPQWIKLFAEAIKEKGARFKYKIQCRADLLLEENNIQWLAQSGCDEVWMGAESGSQKILDAMDKGITIAQIETATTLLKKHGIKPCFFLQFGYPSETMDDIALTLGMVQKLQPFDIGVSVSYPLPGTIFYENVKSQMGTKANWTDSDELAVMFENTFHTQFYKDLHRYLHRSFRASQAIRSLKNSSHDINHKLKKICSIPYHVALKLYHKNQLRKYKYDNVEQLF